MSAFWLELHVDMSVKLFSRLIYLSGEPELRDVNFVSSDWKSVDELA